MTLVRGRGPEEGLSNLNSIALTILSVIEVEVAQFSGGTLRNGHLAVVVNDPFALLEDVCHIVATHGRGAHVTNKGY